MSARVQMSANDLKKSPVAGAGGGTFATVVELREQRELVVSYLHHMAVQRQCHNPLEDAQVVGIANYLDLGLQVSSCQFARCPRVIQCVRTLYNSYTLSENCHGMACLPEQQNTSCLHLWGQYLYWCMRRASAPSDQASRLEGARIMASCSLEYLML